MTSLARRSPGCSILVGRFADGAARASLTVVGASGHLMGASGAGKMVADPAGRVTLDLALD